MSSDVVKVRKKPNDAIIPYNLVNFLLNKFFLFFPLRIQFFFKSWSLRLSNNLFFNLLYFGKFLHKSCNFLDFSLFFHFLFSNIDLFHQFLTQVSCLAYNPICSEWKTSIFVFVFSPSNEHTINSLISFSNFPYFHLNSSCKLQVFNFSIIKRCLKFCST